MISPGSSPRCMRRNIPVVVPSTAPPPLPPRKSSPTHEQTLLPTTSNIAMRNGTHSNLGLSEAQSVTNLTHNTIDIPHIPKSNSMLNINHRNSSSENEVVELSSPETIYGVVIQNSDYYDKNIIDIKIPNRHLSCPSNRSAPKAAKPVKSSTSPNISYQTTSDPSLPQYENVDLEIPRKNKKKVNPLERETNVSYENLNMDYIKKLVSEGYSRDSVIKALGITRNNVDMACDILHEFGTKLG